jgi:hypothetical protein
MSGEDDVVEISKTKKEEQCAQAAKVGCRDPRPSDAAVRMLVLVLVLVLKPANSCLQSHARR